MQAGNQSIQKVFKGGSKLYFKNGLCTATYATLVAREPRLIAIIIDLGLSPIAALLQPLQAACCPPRASVDYSKWR